MTDWIMADNPDDFLIEALGSEVTDDPYIEVSEEGVIVTALGMKSLGPYARRIGIKLEEVRSYQEYLDIRELLSQFFWERLGAPLQGVPDSIEIRILKAIASRDQKKLQRLSALHCRMKKRKFKVVD